MHSKSNVRKNSVLKALTISLSLILVFEFSIGFYKLQNDARNKQRTREAVNQLTRTLPHGSFRIISAITRTGNLYDNNSAFFSETVILIELKEFPRDVMKKALQAQNMKQNSRLQVIENGQFVSMRDEYQAPSNPNYMLITITKDTNPVTLGEYFEWLS